MNKGKVRIYELSKDLELENKDILAICEKLNIAVKSHSSTISEEDAEQIRKVATSSDYKPARRAARPPKVDKPTRSSGVKPVAKPVRPPREQQILEIRRYPKPATPPGASRSQPSSAPGAKPSADAKSATPKPPTLSAPPPRPGSRTAASAGRPSNQANSGPSISQPPNSAGSVDAPAVPASPPEAPKAAAPPLERIVTTSGATRPDQLKPRLVAPPSRPANKPAGRSEEDDRSSRVARPVLKRDRGGPSRSDDNGPREPRPGRPRLDSSGDDGLSAPPAPKKPVLELRRPVSRKTAVESTDTDDETDTDDDQSFVDPALELRRPTAPRPPKRRDRTAVEDDDEQEIRPKKVTKTKRQRVIVDDDDDFEELQSASSDVSQEQMSLSLMRPPKPRGQRQAKPAPTTKKSKQRTPSRRERRERRQEVVPEKPEMIVLTGGISVHDLAEQLSVPQTDIIKLLFFKGIATNVNQTLDMPTAEMVATEFGVEAVTAEEAPEARKVTEMIDDQDLDNLVARPPVVTIMGHVDHGKTSLLDYIRQAKVTEGEAGGITQHIGAYHVDLKSNPNSDRKSGQIVFLDTPGHEAFTAMRARGTRVTDIAILVVAADDGVRPQTIEAISHAKAAGVPIVVAINKIDKEAANPDRVKQELMEYELVPEEYGGDTIMVPVSAITGENVDTILEMLLLVAEVEDLQANPERLARGTVIEAHLDKARGPVATLLVQNGTLKIGDAFAAGPVFGRVKAMIDDRGHRSEEVKPSFAVEVLGLNDVPPAGEEFEVYSEERNARAAADEKAIEQRQSRLAQTMASRRVTLNSLSEQAKEGELKELNLILKADVQGSLEAILGSLQQLPQNEVQIRVLMAAPGEISETDVDLAAASGAVIIGFNTTVSNSARLEADNMGVDIQDYDIIYKLLEDIEGAMEGLLEPEMVEESLGQVEVRAVFPVRKGTVAGCYVLSGKVTRNCRVRVNRGGDVVYVGNLDSLKRMKDDAKEVNAGFECGIAVGGFNDWKEGDIIDAFKMVSQRRTLARV
ncbi:translation initiation factor IF-2, putative [Synechococcus sp. PCC 7335]|uniref:translation initiation factor IF-2 n=1 Tax=Synechococcus sp. (strain ATCC 29403 / PCC 7335) TaxID=91464 RepID=UPI00017EC3B9|nr:translation initiation factor IF-2 [Synechococcus sp. PCC 7335]EDX85577.1 translation initiation factor IF-2, putative [Synechococcus sp. PCC 7335]